MQLVNFAEHVNSMTSESCVGFRITGSVLASHPLVLTALSSLNSEPLSEASVNGIIVGKS
jgi:hypothetical protein